MIEIKLDSKKRYQLFIDNAPIKGAQVIKNSPRNSPKRFKIDATGREAIEKLTSFSIADIVFTIGELSLRYKFDWFDFIRRVEVGFTDLGRKSIPRKYLGMHATIAFMLRPPFEWKGDYSFSEYFQELSLIVDAANHEKVFIIPKDKEYVGSRKHAIIFIPSYSEQSLANEIEQCSEILRDLHEKTKNALAARISGKSVITSFEFPEEVRTYCEQYLVYFVQFLKDLGLEASHEFKHEAGRVLFAVTPNDPKEALDKIRTALEVYLRLPSSPISQNMGVEIAIQRLESQVLRLQSDLRLAAAELLAKNTTIEAQQLIITVQKSLLNGEVIMDSVKNVTPKARDEDREEFFDGAAALTVYKKEGIEINLPKIFRRLKGLFAEKK